MKFPIAPTSAQSRLFTVELRAALSSYGLKNVQDEIMNVIDLGPTTHYDRVVQVLEAMGYTEVPRSQLSFLADSRFAYFDLNGKWRLGLTRDQYRLLKLVHVEEVYSPYESLSPWLPVAGVTGFKTWLQPPLHVITSFEDENGGTRVKVKVTSPESIPKFERGTNAALPERWKIELWDLVREKLPEPMRSMPAHKVDGYEWPEDQNVAWTLGNHFITISMDQGDLIPFSIHGPLRECGLLLSLPSRVFKWWA